MTQARPEPHSAPSRLRFCLSADPPRLRRARERIRDYLQHHCSDSGAIDDLVLCIDEACANVMRHSESPDLEIALGFRKDDLQIDVKDRGKGFDVSTFAPAAAPDPMQIGGRGLYIMAKLSDKMSLTSDHGTKVHMVKRAVQHQRPTAFESGLDAVPLAPESSHRDGRLRAFLEEIDEVFMALDWEYRCTHVNEAAVRFTGLPREDLMGHRPWECRPELAGCLERSCYEAMELGRPATIEQRASGEGSWFEARVYPTSTGVSLYLREIDERKRVEAERERLIEDLSQSEERFRATFEQAAVGIVHAALDGRLTRVNSTLCRMLCYRREDLERLTLQELVADLDNAAQEPALVEALLEGQRKSFSADRRFVLKDRRVVWASITVSLVRTRRGKPGYFVGVIEDVTEKQLAVAALRENERQYRLVTENVSDVIWVLDVDTEHFTYVSPSVASLRGFAPEEALSQTLSQAVTPASMRHLRQVLPKRRSAFRAGTGRSYVDEIEQAHQNGTTVWTETTTRLVANDATGHVEVYGASRDITERKALSDALARERDALATVMANATAMVAYLDRDFTVLMVNDAYAAACGYEPEGMVGLNLLDLHPQEEDAAIFRHVRDTGSPVEYVAKPFQHAGEPEQSTAYRDWRLSPVKDADGEVQALVLSLVDVTDRVTQARYAEELNRVLEDISASLDPAAIVERLAGRTQALLKADCWSVLDRDGDGWRVTLSNEPDQSRGERIPNEGAPLALAALRERHVIAVQSTPAESVDPLSHIQHAGAKSTMVAPLMPASGQFSALCFTWHRHAHEFSKGEMDFVARVAAAASPMLSNARLFHQQKYVARTLQEYFLHPLPDIRGVEVGFVAETAHEAALVGGDFSEVFELDDGRVVVLVGDVSGRGVAAAGMGEIVRGAVRAFAVVDPSPAFILGRTNDLLLQRSQGYDFATAFLLLLDPCSGEAVCTSAGHPPCLHVSPGKCRFVEIATATPLGAFRTGYSDHNLLLETGDTMVFFTDGVTEARSGREEFGSERLRRAVDELRTADVQTIAEGVRDAAQEFAGPLNDDLQVLALRLRP